MKKENKRKMLPHEVIIKFLTEQGFSKKAFVGCEIGVYKARTSINLLQSFPRLFLFMIDHWDAHKIEGSLKARRSQKCMNVFFCSAKTSTKFARRRRTIIRLGSLDAVKDFDDASLDFVFVDAGHFYDQTKADIEAWWPKVRAGGFLFGHDYGGRMERHGKWGVKQAADEFVEKEGVKIQVLDGLVFAVQKP